MISLLLVLTLLSILHSINSGVAWAFDVIDVTDFGAKGDGRTDDTAAIRSALLQANSSNIILFPLNHVFLSQPLNLTSHTTLQVDGVLKSINNEASWPRLPPLPSYNTSEDGGFFLRYQAFIYAYSAHSIKIFGSGVIDGSGEWWWDAFQNNKSLLHAGRPNILQLVHCKFVEVTRVTLRDSPFWCVHPIYCEYVTIHHMAITARTYAPNSDGIDPDSSKHVLIEYNDIGCGDDHIAIKAGRCGASAGDHLHCATDKRFQRGLFETRNITVRYNVFRNGMGIAVGSESSGSIRDVDIHDNVIGVCEPGGDCDDCCGWSPALHVKTTLSRGGALENIAFHDNTVYNTSSFILLNAHYQTHDDEAPDGYDPVLIRNISFVRNQALGTGVHGTWDCSVNDACREITVADNYVRNAVHDPWSCNHIASFSVYGNYPSGLQECMESSTSQTTSSIATQ